MSEDKKPLSIEQAFNYLKENKENSESNAKKEAKKAPISCASEEDRRVYLTYCISLLNDVTEGIKYQFCKLTNKAPVCYTTKEIAKIFKQIMILRIHGFTYRGIAMQIKETEETLKKVEKLIMQVMKSNIEYKRNSEIPLIN